MKKEIILSESYAVLSAPAYRSFKKTVVNRLQLKRRLRRLTVLYSKIANQPLTTSDVLRILHVQISFVALLLPLSSTPWLALVGTAWLSLALWQCRGLKR